MKTAFKKKKNGMERDTFRESVVSQVNKSDPQGKLFHTAANEWTHFLCMFTMVQWYTVANIGCKK